MKAWIAVEKQSRTTLFKHILLRLIGIQSPCPHQYMSHWTFSDDKIPGLYRWLYPTIHYCHEFDGLVIDKFCPENEYCSC